MKDWRTTLGGALSSLGTTLAGVSATATFSGFHPDTMKWFMLSGFILSALGKFFAHLWAADTADTQVKTEK